MKTFSLSHCVVALLFQHAIIAIPLAVDERNLESRDSSSFEKRLLGTNIAGEIIAQTPGQVINALTDPRVTSDPGTGSTVATNIRPAVQPPVR
ncbi:hypothetical protein C8J56DRAFT_1164420 [Mycena floridula]|nr:hypothetical protein C8J56DRAFT_1164420 [Mycena floridula]